MDIVDPYVGMAAYQKAENPKQRIVMRRFRREDVNAVDKLVELAKGEHDIVRTEEEWRLIEIIFQFFMQRWPQEFQEFYDAVPQIRATRRDKGMSESKEMKYVGALPYRFMKLVQVIFPYQRFDKKFVYKLVKRIPLLKIS